MICYRDMPFCADQGECATPETECGRIFTNKDYESVLKMDIPVAYGSFKETCGKFKEKVE